MITPNHIGILFKTALTGTKQERTIATKILKLLKFNHNESSLEKAAQRLNKGKDAEILLAALKEVAKNPPETK